MCKYNIKIYNGTRVHFKLKYILYNRTEYASEFIEHWIPLFNCDATLAEKSKIISQLIVDNYNFKSLNVIFITATSLLCIPLIITVYYITKSIIGK